MIFNIKRILVFLSICVAFISNVNATNKPFVFDKEKYKEQTKDFNYPKEKDGSAKHSKNVNSKNDALYYERSNDHSSSPFDFDKEKYKEHREEYNYPKEKENIPNQQRKQSSLPDFKFSQDLFSKIAWSIFAILIVGGLVYLVYILSKSNNNFISEQESENIINQIEENLIGANLDDLINKAVQSGNYELAVKLNYFKVLKKLVVKELIKYRKDKSNKEYLYELFDTPQFRDYKALNNAFDRLRFAKIALTETEYNHFSNQCSTFISLF